MKKSEIVIPSPLEFISPENFFFGDGIEVWVKRDDLIHPLISGNKYRKLKYNITDDVEGVITFGGAFSNHILATAAYCNNFDIPCIGIIRGEEVDMDNPTLRKSAELGMIFYLVKRSDYSEKEESQEVQKILNSHPLWTIIPEGGTNENAVKGCEEIVEEIFSEIIPDYIFCGVGTGGTASGILRAIKKKNVGTRLVAISCLKADYLEHEIEKLSGMDSNNFTFLGDKHRGGYAKVDPDLITFIHSFYQQTNIPLDPIYNGKVVMALLECAQTGMFEPNSTIVWVHTGGLQGVEGHNYMVRMGRLKHVNEIHF